MPVGDMGGSYSQLIITCYAGEDLECGMPVTICRDYTVMNSVDGNLFGKVLEGKKIGETVPVIVRGVLPFKIDQEIIGRHPFVYQGKIIGSSNAPGVILFQNAERVDVLL